MAGGKFFALITLLSWWLLLPVAYGLEFGEYPEGEAIKWQPLATVDGYSLLISTNVLEVGAFDKESNIWADSEIRRRLNDDFFKSFNKEEQKRIAGEIFLLSREELLKFLPTTAERMPKATNYAEKAGSYHGNNWWWLRSAGERENYAAYVAGDGTLVASGDYVFLRVGGWRPALWLAPSNSNATAIFNHPDSADKACDTRYIAVSLGLIIGGKNREALLSLEQASRENGVVDPLFAELLAAVANSRMGNISQARSSLAACAAEYVRRGNEATARDRWTFIYLVENLYSMVGPELADWQLVARMLVQPEAGARLFARLVKNYPDSNTFIYASLLMAAIYQQNGDKKSARNYLQYVEDYGEPSLAAEAHFRLQLLGQ